MFTPSIPILSDRLVSLSVFKSETRETRVYRRLIEGGIPSGHPVPSRDIRGPSETTVPTPVLHPLNTMGFLHISPHLRVRTNHLSGRFGFTHLSVFESSGIRSRF